MDRRARKILNAKEPVSRSREHRDNAGTDVRRILAHLDSVQAHPADRFLQAGAHSAVRQFARDGNSFPIANAFLLNRRIAMKQVEQLSSARKNPRAWRKRESVYNADLLVRKYCDVWGLRRDTTTAYLCGHPSMCENGQGILKRAGWQKGSMFEEVYFIPGNEAAAK
jgi:hypothetical protein